MVECFSGIYSSGRAMGKSCRVRKVQDIASQDWRLFQCCSESWQSTRSHTVSQEWVCEDLLTGDLYLAVSISLNPLMDGFTLKMRNKAPFFITSTSYAVQLHSIAKSVSSKVSSHLRTFFCSFDMPPCNRSLKTRKNWCGCKHGLQCLQGNPFRSENDPSIAWHFQSKFNL